LNQQKDSRNVTPEKKSFFEQTRNFERSLIAQALAEANGAVTKAARSLGLSHQTLCYIIKARHPELMDARKPVRSRRKAVPVQP
jgi:transcriptional regulator with GAF, ATPase, and Fis domain